MTAIEKVISVARGELGYREKNSASGLDDKTANAGSGNWTKYARDLDAVSGFYNGKKQGYAWCDVFVDWCFVTAFGPETAKALLCQPDRSAGAGCTYSLAYYMQKGQFHRADPRPGDQIFFGSVGNSTHTGLVTAVDALLVHTIEGNSSDGVFERSYAQGAGTIAGYGRPDWTLAGDVSASDTSGGWGPAADPHEDAPLVGVVEPSAPPPVSPSPGGTYTVQKGDTLWGIAAKALGSGERYKDIQRLNGLVSTLIYVGQCLKIPGQSEQAEDKQSAPVNPPETAEDAAEYTVVRGDTLWSIAQRYLGKGTRYKEIMETNGLKSEMIRPGQRLKIPK